MQNNYFFSFWYELMLNFFISPLSSWISILIRFKVYTTSFESDFLYKGILIINTAGSASLSVSICFGATFNLLFSSLPLYDTAELEFNFGCCSELDDSILCSFFAKFLKKNYILFLSANFTVQSI